MTDSATAVINQDMIGSDPTSTSKKLVYTTLRNQSLGNVANQYKEKKLERQFRATAPHEINNYAGAGVLPCTIVDDKLHVLLQQPKRGKKSGSGRWYDLGGKKKHPLERVSDCAARQFTKYSYALFSICTDLDHSKSLKDLNEIYERKHQTWPLLASSGTDWAKMWMLESGAISFFNPHSSYHTFLLPVPFISVDVLGGVCALMEDSKREFQWVSSDIVSSGPLASRVQIRALFRCLLGTGLDSVGSGGMNSSINPKSGAKNPYSLMEMLNRWSHTPARVQPNSMDVKCWVKISKDYIENPEDPKGPMLHNYPEIDDPSYESHFQLRNRASVIMIEEDDMIMKQSEKLLREGGLSTRKNASDGKKSRKITTKDGTTLVLAPGEVGPDGNIITEFDGEEATDEDNDDGQNTDGEGSKDTGEETDGRGSVTPSEDDGRGTPDDEGDKDKENGGEGKKE